MEKLIELISQIKVDISSAEKSFANETQLVTSALSDKHNVLKGIKQEVEDLIRTVSVNLQVATSNLESTNNTIAAKLKEGAVIQANAEAKLSAVNTEIESKAQLIIDQESKLESLRKMIDNYMTEKDSLNGSLASAHVMADKANGELSKIQKENNLVTKQLADAKDELGKVSNENQLLNRDITAKSAEVIQLKQNIELLKTAEMSVIQARLKELNK